MNPYDDDCYNKGRHPLEITVSKHQPVHVHLTRKHLSNEEALRESLSQERQKSGHRTVRFDKCCKGKK